MNDTLIALQKHGRRALKMAAQITPLTAALEIWLTELEEERIKSYYASVAKRGVRLDEEQIKNNNLLHAHVITLRAVANTHRHEKIERFAALFSCFTNAGNFSRVDRYEEVLKILDDLSEVEFQMLLLLVDYEASYPSQPNQTHLQNLWIYWEEFKRDCLLKIGITQEEFRGRVERLKRTGLVQGLDLSYHGPSGEYCYLTPLFRLFVETVGISMPSQWTPFIEDPNT